MSSKIYPSDQVQAIKQVVEAPASTIRTAWTVWKKSSMSFIGSDGFSVYDAEGRLTFRVDNYSRRNKYFVGELLLTDAIGRPILSLRPQTLSMYDQWKGYSGDCGNAKTKSKSHLFTMRRRSLVQSKNDVVDVFIPGGGGGGGDGGGAMAADFRIEGSYKKRCCKIRGREGQVLALISPKKVSSSVVLGEDVFSLSVQGGVSIELMMAFIIIMDRIC